MGERYMNEAVLLGLICLLLVAVGMGWWKRGE
jgi:hypothetical protein